MTRLLRNAAAIAALALFVVEAPAATPPATMNYQGVLRNASDRPLTGTYDMVFRFMDAASGGTEILSDQHAAVTSNVVTVTGGLFDVQLGGGTVTDGTGTGTYTSLADVFRDYGTVYLEIQVGAETLSPRYRIQSGAYALNATNLGGVGASGYISTAAAAQTKAGPLTANATGASQYGLLGYGTNGGGYFGEQSGASTLQAASGGFAAQGAGSSGGAYFTDTSGSSGYLAHTGYGVEGHGSSMGAYLSNNAANGYSYVGYNSYGIQGYGAACGGFFKDNGTGAYSYVGYNGYGIEGFGSNAGGYFQDLEEGAYAYLGTNGYGVFAQSPPGRGGQAGYFVNSSPPGNQAYAVLGVDSNSPYTGAFGIKAVIDGAGAPYGGWPGDFVSSLSGNFARVGYVQGSAYKVYGNGIVSFVQNHPSDRSKLIVYSAPEGDEAAVYTRGTARLHGGEARVRLGETFQWVANPDVGLTAQVTPRGAWADLYVASVGTDELVVRSRDGAGEAEFDYAVWGLRIGLEESQIVTRKTHEAMIPNMSVVRESNARDPELRRFTALERFRAMDAATGVADAAGAYPRAKALHDAIGEFDPQVDSAMKRELMAGGPAALPGNAAESLARKAGVLEPVARLVRSKERQDLSMKAPEETPSPTAANAIQVQVRDSVAPGDLLALDPAGGDVLRVADSPSDPGVVGIVAGDPGTVFGGVAPIALGGSIVSCRVDASFGAIAPGDLLVASATPGHAMRAVDGLHEGRIVAKALQAWPAGTGTIRVLVTAR